jgi:hypothetical protein
MRTPYLRVAALQFKKSLYKAAGNSNALDNIRRDWIQTVPV